jgi:hypothetical protein
MQEDEKQLPSNIVSRPEITEKTITKISNNTKQPEMDVQIINPMASSSTITIPPVENIRKSIVVDGAVKSSTSLVNVDANIVSVQKDIQKNIIDVDNDNHSLEKKKTNDNVLLNEKNINNNNNNNQQQQQQQFDANDFIFSGDNNVDNEEMIDELLQNPKVHRSGKQRRAAVLHTK